MEITEVKVFPVRDQKLRAFVSIVLDGSFMVNDIKVINGKDGLFISMPSRRKKNGRFKDIAHPLNNETRQAMEKRIIGEYRRVAAEEGQPETAPDRATEAATAPAAAEPSAAAKAPAPDPAPAPAPAPSAAAAPDSPAADADAPEESDAAAAGSAEKPAEGDNPDKSLEEVAEAHLSDSYWTS